MQWQGLLLQYRSLLKKLTLVALGIVIVSGIIFAVSDKAGKKKIKPTPQKEDRVATLTTQLLQASAKYSGEADEAKHLIQIAQERKTIALAEIKTDPKRFLNNALPKDISDKFLNELKPFIEHEVTVSGNIEVIHADNFNENKSTTDYTLTSNNISYNIHFAENPPGLNVVSTPQITGIVLDNEIVLETGNSLRAKETNVLGISSDNKIMAILVNFKDNQTVPPFTKENIEQTFREVDQYYQTVLPNRFSFSASVHGWLTLSLPYNEGRGICEGKNVYKSVFNYINDAKLKAFPGINLDNPTHYNIFFLIFPRIPSCTFEGSALTETNNILINGVNNPSVFVHELGHLLPFEHAASVSCQNRAVENYQNCEFKQYGDPFDPMGNNLNILPDFNLPHHVEAGNLLSDVQTVHENGMYTISPLGTSGATIGIKISKPDTNEDYYLEYRQPTNYDSSLPSSATEGVLIHTASGTSPPLPWFAGFTRLIDTTPTTRNLFDAALSDGRSFVDNVNGITITQISHDAAGATLSLEFGRGICNFNDPVLTIGPKSQSGEEGEPASYTFTITNYDSSVCNSTNFDIIFSPPNEKLEIDKLPGVIKLFPGETKSFQFNITEQKGLAIGSHKFTVYAERPPPFNKENQSFDTATYVSFGEVDLDSLCSTYDNEVQACDNTGGKCAYYFCTETCRPYGTTLEEGCKNRKPRLALPGREEEDGGIFGAVADFLGNMYEGVEDVIPVLPDPPEEFEDEGEQEPSPEPEEEPAPPPAEEESGDCNPILGFFLFYDCPEPTPTAQPEPEEQLEPTPAEEEYEDFLCNIPGLEWLPTCPQEEEPPPDEEQPPDESGFGDYIEEESREVLRIVADNDNVLYDKDYGIYTDVNVHLPGTEGYAQDFAIPVAVYYTNGDVRYTTLNLLYQPDIPPQDEPVYETPYETPSDDSLEPEPTPPCQSDDDYRDFVDCDSSACGWELWRCPELSDDPDIPNPKSFENPYGGCALPGGPNPAC